MAQEEPQDSVQVFADALRSKGGIENRAAVLEGQRFELFRGKDLVRWVKAHPERGAAAAAGKGGEGPEDQARYLGQQLLRRQLARRVDRQIKKTLPGSKKLVKFPRKLAMLPPQEATTFVEEGFYIWMYERPVSPWAYVWTALIPLAVVGACLFPLAPNWAKVGVFYLTAGLLALILGVLALRSVVALATWLVSGRTLWLLPNVMSEELPISQIFKPLVSVSKPEEGKGSKWGNHPLTRAAVGAAVGALLFVLYRHSPDSAAIKKETSRYRDDLMDWLGVQREGYQRLSGNATAEMPVNATASATADAAAGGAAEAGAGAAEAATEAAEAAGTADAAAEAEVESAADEAAEASAAAGDL
ncbi:Translocation sec62 [Chlorella sorokiniana]|uniref:Translocation protein SEC62 n=1 Tax=Chlorella sorokiniana TaxID=3076 RepID=A0A2P6TX06_CHLSO|nr:Translocation sec62 [Chlorella sorokiniana]|eukprot:PRW58596.1 Translocation sec62 [Chlorella sorokiniana]